MSIDTERGARRGPRAMWRWLALVVALPAMPAAAEPGSPAKDVGVYVFPKDKQSAEQQKKDEGECYAAAKEQSGVDPKKPPPKGPSASEQQAAANQAAQTAPEASGGKTRGAVKGGAVGALGGAVLGAPLAGAAVGAAVGTVRGGTRQREENAQIQQQAAANATAQQQQEASRKKAAYKKEMDDFKRAFGACLDARGYSVK